MRRATGSTVDVGAFGASVGIAALFVLWGVFLAENLAAVASAVLGFLMGSFGWVFILSTFGFLIFVVYLAFSRHGTVKLGAPERLTAPEPERAATRPPSVPAPQQMRSEPVARKR